jgi:2-oxoglutarate dehydrogenase E2 component (dihydrolipoamide succinyltransferase)
VQVGQTIAIIETEGDAPESSNAGEDETPSAADNVTAVEETVTQAKETASGDYSDSERFYSPLVKNIAKQENIELSELETINGTGKDGRVTKDDILSYVKEGKKSAKPAQAASTPQPQKAAPKPAAAPVSVNGDDEIIEMSRMGKMISHHMVNSVQTSAHVQSFIEVDVTKIWNWRNKVKNDFQKREGEKITFTPIFMQAVAKTIKDFPMINIAVDGDRIIKRKNINLGMAAALPDGNLIVPVIKNADRLNLVGMSKAVNDLAGRARAGKLKPDDTQGGTYTVTNVGTFGSIMGTPIINQPQVGILALGAIRKVPAVIETPDGDFIGIRYKMFLSHSYDHRVVNGALGGQFVQRVAQYLESFDDKQSI